MAKTPDIDSNFYDYLILFEHEDIEIVKTAMKFLITFKLACPDNFILTVDLPDLYKHGMKIRDFINEQKV